MRVLCIYHGNCADGFTAAWCVRQALGDAVEFHAALHHRPPPDVNGREVVIVDFSYKRPVLEAMAAQANSVLVLDHHKSAAEDLAGFPPPLGDTWPAHVDDVTGWASDGTDPRLPRVLFDMERSGAGIAWDYFMPHRSRPRLVDVVEDRDLWRFALPHTREIQACIFSYGYTFDNWDRLAAQCQDFPQTLVDEGWAIERKHFKDVHELVGALERRMVIGGHVVPVANVPYTLASDAGNLLCNTPDGEGGMPPFAACYWDTADGRQFSLRSLKGRGVDVQAIAVRYGGGGHATAAGFLAPRGWEGDDTPEAPPELTPETYRLLNDQAEAEHAVGDPKAAAALDVLLMWHGRRARLAGRAAAKAAKAARAGDRGTVAEE